MKREHTWRWPIASYLFLGGLGGGMLAVAAAADLFFGIGDLFALGSLIGAIAIGLGSALLVFDLGRPFFFWRVFSRQKAILTFGAWMLTLAMLCGLIYFLSFLSFIPWFSIEGVRLSFAWICLLLGLGTAIYTGVFIGTIKARPFWNSPVLPVLFLISALSTGVALQSLLVPVQILSVNANDISGLLTSLHALDAILIILEIIILLSYVFIMYKSSTVTASRIAATWINGDKKIQFWVGMILIGLVLPLVFYIVNIHTIIPLGASLVLIGGIILRFLVIYTDSRVMLPGEEELLSWLPEGKEKFLQAWEEHLVKSGTKEK
jgi:protein NrfD